MKSKRAAKWIKDMTHPLKSTSGMAHAVELAEQDARERAIKTFCDYQCNPHYYPDRCVGCKQKKLFEKLYDNA